jgi:hypothetical protein
MFVFQFAGKREQFGSVCLGFSAIAMKDRVEREKSFVGHLKVDRSVSLVLSVDAIIAGGPASIAAVFFKMKAEFLLAFVGDSSFSV